MPTWPVTLPQLPLANRYTEKPANKVLRTPMEDGPAKTRRKFRHGVTTVTIVVGPCTNAQVEIFEEFYEDEIASGSLSFTWVHPRTGVPKSVRIITDSLEYTHQGGDNYFIAMKVEIL